MVEIVEIVEQYLLGPKAIRPIYRDQKTSDLQVIRVKDEEQLIDELLRVSEKVLERYPQLGKPEDAIMKAFFVWHGCVNIDKVCRHTDIHGIKPQNRNDVHNWLLAQSNTNPWILPDPFYL